MAQLVGRPCALCGKEIDWVGDSRFCAACHAPVHNKCSTAAVARPAVDGCSACGNPVAAPAIQSETPPPIAFEWWQAGLLGGAVLSLATAVKVISAIVKGAAGEADLGETAGLAAAVFGIGFLCGVLAWAGKGLSRRFGMAGEALVGAVVMAVFFLLCTLLFAPEFLGSKFASGGVPMLGLAVIGGGVGGAKLGRDLRKG